MAFLEDPRLRQRWNQISHTTETVTENAAAGIWSFSHNYINPCLAAVSQGVESCTAPCIGDREERARRRRERERTHGRAEYSFDFYDDWYADEEDGGYGGSSSGGLLGSWSNEDWDQLLAGTGAVGSRGGEVSEQPKRRRGMSYGTRGQRRRPSVEDPTVIPSTQPIGFLGKLPWKIGGTLRYKPSAADLQDHPGHHDENTPLLQDDGADDDDDDDHHAVSRVLPRHRKRSGTTGSGDTSDSYRSRGDLFPSDGEGDEDAVALDDEFTLPMDRAADDRSSNKTRSSKGKRPAGSRVISRTMSRTTVASQNSLAAHSSTESMRALGERERERTPYLDGPHVEQEPEPATDKEASDVLPNTVEVHDIEFEAEEGATTTSTHEPEPIPPQEEQPPCGKRVESPTPPPEQNSEPTQNSILGPVSERPSDTRKPALDTSLERPREFIPARLPNFT